MKFAIKNIFCSLALAAMSAVGLTGCVTDGEGPDCPDRPDPEVDALVVSFRVAVPSPAASRAATPPVPDNGDAGSDWSDYLKGEEIEFENTLLARNFTVTLYNATDNSYLGRVSAFVLDKITSSTGNGDYYDFRGVLELQNTNMTEAELGAITAKMAITANGEPTDAQKVAALSATNGLAALTFSKIGQQKDFDAIPMWGVASKSLAGIKKGVSFDFGDISLLRAMAKIEVNFDRSATSAVKDLELTGVTMNRTNPSGYLLPDDWSTVPSTSAITLEKTLRIPPALTSVPSATFTPPSAKESIIFYVPEIENRATDEIVLTVGYKDATGADQTGEIRFVKYGTDGKPVASATPWNIIRNHHYSFTITQVPEESTPGEFEVIWTVCDMDDGGVIKVPGFN